MIRKLALAIALWLAPLPALAALAIDSQESAATGHGTFNTSPLTWSFTNTAGTLLLVGACVNNTNNSTNATLGTVTYNGVAMTQISGTVNTVLDVGNQLQCAIYQLLSPATGAHTVSVSASPNVNYTGIIAGAISFTGNDMTTPTGNPGIANGTGATASVSLTGTSNGNIVVGVVATGSGVSAGSGSTTITWKDNQSFNDIGDNAAMGQQSTSGGTVSAAFSLTSDVWGISALEVFVASGAAAATSPGLELVGVGGTLNHGDGSPGGGGALAPGFFVSSTGNDNNQGTLASPWLTLFHAQQVMRGNSCNGTPTGLCLTYVRGGRGGSYALSSTVSITSADSGETFRFYPPDGVNSALLTGSGSLQPVSISGASNFTWNGIAVATCPLMCVSAFGGDSVTVENSDLSGTTTNDGGAAGDGVLTMGSTTNCRALNNYVHNANDVGISLIAFDPNTSINGCQITGNAVIDTIKGSVGDSGAIYLSMRATGTSGGSASVTNNYVRDYGNTSFTGNVNGNDFQCVYLDDNASNVTVTGNVCGPPTAGAPTASFDNNSGMVLQNGGVNDTITGNLFDLGFTTRQGVALFSANSGNAAPGVPNHNAGTVLQHNIVICSAGIACAANTSASGITGFAYQDTDFTGTISLNGYTNYGAGAISSNGHTVSDASPQSVSSANGKLTCTGGTYSIDPTSTFITGATAFPGITGGWGPPGFTIPASTNHSC